MTRHLLAVLCAAGFSLASAPAQQPAPSPEPRASSPEAHRPVDINFVLMLSSAGGKDGEGLSVIVTPPQTFNLSRSGLVFTGTLAWTDSGAYRLDYLLETNAANGGTIHTGASVILAPGEPVQLVRNGDQFYNLRMDRYPPPENKGPGIGFVR